jgi:hypothetical protein
MLRTESEGLTRRTRSKAQQSVRANSVITDSQETLRRLVDVSDKVLPANLPGSVPGLLDGLSASGSWLADGEEATGAAMPIQVNQRPAQAPPQVQQQQAPRPPGKDPKQRGEFYANIGEAIRTLKREIPQLFQKDLTYDIYRDDIIFRDPKNMFQGKKDYKTIFWSLRFHGQLFFRMLYVDVQRIWESPENVKDAGTVLKMRWTVHGVPRVPWEAEGIFDGISTFKVDSNGKIFEHAVNNLILRDPPKQGNPILAGLNLIRLPQTEQVPCPGAWFKALKGDKQEGTEGAVNGSS